jgi:hypothetical protein
MAPQDLQAAALLAHVVAQIEHNVNFLASQDYISQNDASSILTKLPNVANSPNPSGINGLAARVSNMVRNPSTPGTRSPAPPPPARSTLPQVKALWAYSGEVRVQSTLLIIRLPLISFQFNRKLMTSLSNLGISSTWWKRRMRIGGRGKCMGSKVFSHQAMWKELRNPSIHLHQQRQRRRHTSHSVQRTTVLLHPHRLAKVSIALASKRPLERRRRRTSLANTRAL